MAMDLHSDGLRNRIIAIIVTVILHCFSSDAYAVSYDLIVDNGTGSGSYALEALVGVAADPPLDGMEFDVWVGDTSVLADPDAANTTLAMPARSVKIRASFRVVAGDLRTFRQVPYVVALDKSRFADLLNQGNERVVRMALFGDSQETAPSGGGVVYMPRLNYQAFLHYGNSPETLIEPLASQPSGWLVKYQKFNGKIEKLGAKALGLPHTQIVKLGDRRTKNLIATLLNSGEQALAGTFLSGETQPFLSTADGIVKAQVFALTQSKSGEVLWEAKPHDSPGVNILSETSNSGILRMGGLKKTGVNEFKIRSGVTDALDFNGKQYMQLKLSSSVQDTVVAVAGLRFFNETHHYGLVINDFSRGGYRIRQLLDLHHNAGDMYRAYEFDAAILHLGANDAGSRSTATRFKSETLEVIAMIRGWMNDPDYKIILMGDPDLKTWEATDVRRAEFDQFPVVQEEIALADPNVLMVNSRRLADDFYDWRLGHPKLDDYLVDIVHYAPEGGRVLAKAEMDALLGILAPVANTYRLTVNNGTGGGTYTQGTPVDITANTKLAGHEFLRWTGGTGALDNPDAAKAIVIMPAVDIDVTATYQATKKSKQNISFTLPDSKNLDHLAFTVDAATTSGLSPVFSSLTIDVCTVSGNRVFLVSAGTCAIAANQAGNDIYLAAQQVIAKITINKTEQSIRFIPPGSKNLGDAPFSISATATSGLTPVFSSLTVAICTVDGNRVSLIDTGDCIIAADQAGDSNNHAAPRVTGLIVIDALNNPGILASVTTDHNWHHVDIAPLSENAVMIIAPPSFHGQQPGVMRVQKPITGGGFDLRFQEWDYLDGTHKSEIVPYMVLEKGRHSMSDGSIWEVGTFALNGTAFWVPQMFLQSFAEGIPRLFLTIQTSNGLQAVSVRARNVTQTGFEAALFEQQQLMDGHKVEQVGYLAIYSANTSGSIVLGSATWPYHLQQANIDHQWQAVLSSALKLEEEQSTDLEVRHKTENIDILSLGSYLFAQDVSSLGGDSIALRQKPVESTSALE